MSDSGPEINTDPKVFASLNALELRFHEAENELLKRQVELFTPLYKERDPLLLDIPKFWVTVIGETQELEELFNLEDSKLLDHLKALNVTRSEEEPKNFTINMTFEENEFLESSSLTLSKEFNKVDDGSDSYTSKVCPIQWKKDLTAHPEGGRPSFFQFFNWTGSDDDVFEQGEEVALILADEVYPDALKAWSEAQDVDDDEDSDVGSVDIQSVDDQQEGNEDGEGPQKKKARTG